ncbi:MAG: serine/threonine protein kinase [Planctomycetes bacterium]|nr:serine/threonine protein kinase [Planctomycetota bacterium]
MSSPSHSTGRPSSGRLLTTIGPYQVEHELGRGATGVVYAVRLAGQEKTYALKLIRDLEGIDPEGLARFQREAELSARINHPGVVGAIDAGAYGPHRYLVLPLVEGDSLAERLRRETRLPPLDAARLVAQIARALAAVHAQGIVHRDLKPDNILLDQALGGAPRITDFGIARQGVGRGSLTQSSTFLGTPAYMSPEQINAASQVDGKADVYSLASVLYECICGVPPFRGMTALEVADQVLNSDPPLLSLHAADVPASLQNLCLQALAKDPADRPDAAAFAVALEEVLTEDPVTSGGRRGIAVAVGIVLLVLAGVGAALGLGSNPKGDLASAAASQAAPSRAAVITPARLADLEARTLEAAPFDPSLKRDLLAIAEASEAGPDLSGSARLVLGDYLLRRSRLSEALTEFKAIAKRAEVPLGTRRRANLLRAAVLARLGKPGESALTETDLVFDEPQDPVGKLVRARRLIDWERPKEAIALLDKELGRDRVDRIAAQLACRSGVLDAEAQEKILERAPTESDPALLMFRAALWRTRGNESKAAATEGRIEALCRGRDYGPLLRAQIEVKLEEVGDDDDDDDDYSDDDDDDDYSDDDDAKKEPEEEPEEKRINGEILELAKRAFKAEPNAMNGVTLLSRGGGGSAQERKALFFRYRDESPRALTRLRALGHGDDLPALKADQTATPFFPGDESWFWARARVERLPRKTRRSGFQALVAAIGGDLAWSQVLAHLEAAKDQDPDSGEVALLGAEICMRRGRLPEVVHRLKGISVQRKSARLRARLALYQGREEDAIAAWNEIKGSESPEGQLAQVEVALATQQMRLAESQFRALDERKADVLLARVDWIQGTTRKRYGGRGGRRGRGRWGNRGEESHEEKEQERQRKVAQARADLEVARKFAQARADLEVAQRMLGSLDMRIGIARGSLSGGWWVPLGELNRVGYFAGGIDVPASLFLRGKLQGIASRNRGTQQSMQYWGREFVDPIIAALGGKDASPVLSIYLALYERTPELARSRAEAAYARDDKVKLPEHFLRIVESRFGDRAFLAPK